MNPDPTGYTMKCPRCGKQYPPIDPVYGGTHLSCDVCHVPLEGSPSAYPAAPPWPDQALPYPRAPGLASFTDVTSIAEAYARNTGKTIIVRRWLACLIDYSLLVGMLIMADGVLGNELYRRTLALWLFILFAYFPVLEGFSGV